MISERSNKFYDERDQGMLFSEVSLLEIVLFTFLHENLKFNQSSEVTFKVISELLYQY